MKHELELEPIESGCSSLSQSEPSKTTYNGFEKRIKTRRITADRREIVRFDPLNGDRRSGHDQRGSSQKWACRL